MTATADSDAPGKEFKHTEPEGEKNRQPSAPPQRTLSRPRVLTGVELEALRARLHRKFH